MEAEAVYAGGGAGGQPDPPPPLVVADRTAMRGDEDEGVGFGSGQAATPEMGGEGLNQHLWEAQGPATGAGLRGSCYRGSAETPGLLLCHGQFPPQQVKVADPQADRLTPSQTEDGSEPHDRRVIAEGHSKPGQIVDRREVAVDGLDGRKVDCPAGRADDEVVRYGGVADGPEHPELTANGPRRLTMGNPVVDQTLYIARSHRTYGPPTERRFHMQPHDRLVPSPAAISLRGVGLEPSPGDLGDRSLCPPGVDPSAPAELASLVKPVRRFLWRCRSAGAVTDAARRRLAGPPFQLLDESVNRSEGDPRCSADVHDLEVAAAICS